MIATVAHIKDYCSEKDEQLLKIWQSGILEIKLGGTYLCPSLRAWKNLSANFKDTCYHYHCLKYHFNFTSSKAFFCPEMYQWFLQYLKNYDLRIRNLNCTGLILEHFRYPLQVLRQLIRPYSLTRKLMGKPCSNLHRKVSKCQVSSFQLLDEWVAKRHLFGCAAPVKSGWGKRKGYNLVVSLPVLV